MEAGFPVQVLGNRLMAHQALSAFYGANGYQRVWQSAELRRQLIDSVEQASHDGLNPADYHADILSGLALRPMSDFSEDLRADLDLLFSDAFLMLSSHMLVGKVNRDIVGSINTHGPLAVGLSGEDGGLITSVARHPDLGFVGDIESVNPSILHRLLAEDLIPVVSTIGGSADGQAYNINADTVAGALAGALGAEKVVYLTDVAGLLADVDDPDSLIGRATAVELRAKIASGALTGGMIPKIEAAVAAVESGVPSAHLLDGRLPHVVLLELFSDHGVGTMITRHPHGEPGAPT